MRIEDSKKSMAKDLKTGNSIIKFEQWEIEQIKESERQIERGEFYTEEESNKLTEKWFEGK